MGRKYGNNWRSMTSFKRYYRMKFKKKYSKYCFSSSKNDLTRFKLNLYTDDFAKEIAYYKADINYYG